MCCSTLPAFGTTATVYQLSSIQNADSVALMELAAGNLPQFKALEQLKVLATVPGPYNLDSRITAFDCEEHLTRPFDQGVTYQGHTFTCRTNSQPKTIDGDGPLVSLKLTCPVVNEWKRSPFDYDEINYRTQKALVHCSVFEALGSYHGSFATERLTVERGLSFFTRNDTATTAEALFHLHTLVLVAPNKNRDEHNKQLDEFAQAQAEGQGQRTWVQTSVFAPA